MLQRQPFQARYEFEIRGITNEVCYSDIHFQKDNDDDCAARLDRLQFQAQNGNVGETYGFDDQFDIREPEMMNMSEPVFETDDIDSEESDRHNHVLLEEAFKSLTDRQATPACSRPWHPLLLELMSLPSSSSETVAVAAIQ